MEDIKQNQNTTSMQSTQHSETDTATNASDIFPNRQKPIPEKVLLEWTSPSRPFKKRKRQFFSNVAIIVLLVCLILFFAGQVLPIAVVISVAFLVYVLYTIPPGESKHTITNYGIYTDESAYPWDEMGRYWFDSKFDQQLLLIEIAQFPGRITILTGKIEKKQIEKILDQVLVQAKPPDTQFDKWAQWLQDKIPLE